MSESMYLLRQSGRFLAMHPREDGWMVYELSSDTAHLMYLPYLLDCLQGWHPDALKRRTAHLYVGETSLMKSSCQSPTVAEGASLDAAKEVDSYGWSGSVEIEWNGNEIHFLQFPAVMGKSCVEIYFVATKSNAALRDFIRVLGQYGQARHKVEKEILVINGENIPIAPSSWEDVVLPAGMTRDIQANVHAFFNSQERYQRLGIPHRRGFVFAGPPGCGKTLMLKTLAYNTPAKFITVLGKANIDDHEISTAFHLAEKYTPAVVLLEDLDRIVHAKGISLSYFLNMLDGLKVLNGVLLIATCNEPDKLDPALIHRPSRFDRVWRFELPKYEQRLDLLRKRGGGFFSESALQTAAHRSEGFSMAYVQEIVVNTLLACAHNETCPNDESLLSSLETLREQRKSASKPGESVDEHESVGFCPSNNGDR